MTTENKLTERYLKDGYLVVGLVRHTGCTSYKHEDKEQEISGEALEAKWKTIKNCRSFEEEKRMTELNYELNKRMFKLGVRIGNFGTMVPKERGEELDTTLKDIELEVLKYNASAKYTRLYAELSVFAVSGNDERVAKVMYDRVAEVLYDVMQAIDAGDIRRMRLAMCNLNGMETILPVRTGEKLNDGIEKARQAAKAAVKAVKEIARDEERAAVASKMLKDIGVAGLRATFVEMSGELSSKLSTVSRLPVTDARQIE